MFKKYYKVEMFGEDVEDNVVVVRGHRDHQKDVGSIIALGGVKKIYLTDHEGNAEKLVYEAIPASGEFIEISDDIENLILYKLKMLNDGIDAVQEYVESLHDQIGKLRGRAVAKEAKSVFNNVLDNMREDVNTVNELVYREENEEL